MQTYQAPIMSERESRPAAAWRDLADWLSYAERLHPHNIELGLQRVSAVRDALGLVPDFVIITVAGTNGKGSTCAMLEAILCAAGLSVGCYTSPHLVRYNERVRLNGKTVSDADLVRAYARVDAARGAIALTPFEFGTLAAMVVFENAHLDVAILEVGLGGRLDAVNAFDADCAILTSVGIDHTEYLGDTREAIGFEKAGVFRPARPAICADPEPPASVARHAQQIGARLLQIDRDFSYRAETNAWKFISEEGVEPISLPLPALTGSIQLQNAAACLMALKSLEDKLSVTAEHVRTGLRNVRLAGRFQRFAGSPEIILDVAHNPHASLRLADNLRQYPGRGKTFAVFAMLHDKDIAGVAQVLDTQIDAWFIAGIDEKRGASAELMAAALDRAKVHGSVQVAGSIVEACIQAAAAAQPEDRIVVFGSFVTVGTILEQLEAGCD